MEESDSGAVVLGVSAAAGRRREGEFSSVRGGLELVGV